MTDYLYCLRKKIIENDISIKISQAKLIHENIVHCATTMIPMLEKTKKYLKENEQEKLIKPVCRYDIIVDLSSSPINVGLQYKEHTILVYTASTKEEVIEYITTYYPLDACAVDHIFDLVPEAFIRECDLGDIYRVNAWKSGCSRKKSLKPTVSKFSPEEYTRMVDKKDTEYQTFAKIYDEILINEGSVTFSKNISFGFGHIKDIKEGKIIDGAPVILISHPQGSFSVILRDFHPKLYKSENLPISFIVEYVQRVNVSC